MKRLMSALFLSFLFGCTALGIPTATTFNEKITAAYALNATIRTTSVTLMDAKKITADDGQNILNQNDNARAGIEIARKLALVDQTAANGKLTSIRTILVGIQAYLATKGGN